MSDKDSHVCPCCGHFDVFAWMADDDSLDSLMAMIQQDDKSLSELLSELSSDDSLESLLSELDDFPLFDPCADQKPK